LQIAATTGELQYAVQRRQEIPGNLLHEISGSEHLYFISKFKEKRKRQQQQQKSYTTDAQTS